MAAIIGTATRVIGLFGTDDYGTSLDGFTSGNLAGGVQPTQLSADWFNSCQQEINNASRAGLGYALDPTDYSQLAYSIDNQITERKPRFQSSVTASFRTQADSALSSIGRNSVVWSKTAFVSSVPVGTTTTILTMPTTTNSLAMVEFDLVSSQTDAPANCGMGKIMAGVRNVSGLLTLFVTTSLFSSTPLVGWTAIISTSGSNILLRLTLPAGGNPHNAFGSCRSTSVVRV